MKLKNNKNKSDGKFNNPDYGRVMAYTRYVKKAAGKTAALISSQETDTDNYAVEKTAEGFNSMTGKISSHGKKVVGNLKSAGKRMTVAKARTINGNAIVFSAGKSKKNNFKIRTKENSFSIRTRKNDKQKNIDPVSQGRQFAFKNFITTMSGSKKINPIEIILEALKKVFKKVSKSMVIFLAPLIVIVLIAYASFSFVSEYVNNIAKNIGDIFGKIFSSDDSYYEDIEDDSELIVKILRKEIEKTNLNYCEKIEKLVAEKECDEVNLDKINPDWNFFVKSYLSCMQLQNNDKLKMGEYFEKISIIDSKLDTIENDDSEEKKKLTVSFMFMSDEEIVETYSLGYDSFIVNYELLEVYDEIIDDAINDLFTYDDYISGNYSLTEEDETEIEEETESRKGGGSF